MTPMSAFEASAASALAVRRDPRAVESLAVTLGSKDYNVFQNVIWAPRDNRHT